MKNLFLTLLLLATLLGVAQAVYQPQYLGWTTQSISSGTVNEICISTPPTVGYQRFCTNCVSGDGKGTVCTSTGTNAPGAGCDFTLSTGTQCK